MIGYYLTHPQVSIDPNIPVSDWTLSPLGRQRIEAILHRSWLGSLRRIVSSTERKAIDGAQMIGTALGIPVEQHAEMGENDRSSTGFLPPEAFEAAADCFFAEPEASWKGWERAVDAQARIVRAVDAALAGNPADEPVLFVGHGAVGALLKCRLAGRPISRREDQPHGGGNLFAFRLADRQLLCEWTPIELFGGIDDER